MDVIYITYIFSICAWPSLSYNHKGELEWNTRQLNCEQTETDGQTQFSLCSLFAISSSSSPSSSLFIVYSQFFRKRFFRISLRCVFDVYRFYNRYFHIECMSAVNEIASGNFHFDDFYDLLRVQAQKSTNSLQHTSCVCGLLTTMSVARVFKAS